MTSGLGEKLPRGIRNNNPGNLRIGMPWAGLMAEKDKKGVHASEREFCVFTDPKWGIRALARVLIVYGRTRRAKDGSRIDTVREVIERWAPPNENDTDTYAQVVARFMRLPGADEKIDLTDEHTIFQLTKAIIRHENGCMPYHDEMIREGIRLAGIRPVPPK